jgi:hypothetical protein
VVYDHLADRWLLSQFNGASFMCIAISQTPDPTAGTWFLYTFNMGSFPDYPKFGVWPDGYYMTSYLGNSLGVYAFDRAKMLVGQAATFVQSSIPALGTASVRDTRILPADLDGPAPAAAGTPNYFVRTVDSRQDPGFPVDRVEVYEFAVNFATNTFTFTLADTLAPAAFNTMACNRNRGGIRDCVPQPATNGTVDALSNRPMMQLRFRDFGTHLTMLVSQTINVKGSMPFPVPDLDVAGIRWYELRKAAGGPWSIFQQGTYSPQPAGVTNRFQLLHRWMSSAAMDKFGNIAIGYNVANDDNGNPIFPGIRYAGREVSDPPGTLGAELTITNGTNSQTQGTGARWGDYATMSVDPVDDCTFWFTTHLAGAGGTGPRPTRIAAFKFSNCVAP